MSTLTLLRGRSAVGWAVAIFVLAVGVATVVVVAPSAAMVLVPILVVGILCVRRPRMTGAILLVVAVPFLRPAIMGEHYAAAATGLCVLAAVCSFAADRGLVQVPKPFLVMVVFLSLAQLWLALRAGLGAPAYTSSSEGSLKGLISMPLPLLAIGIILSDADRRLLVMKSIAWITIAFCASYTVTASLWVLTGLGSGSMLSFSITPGTMTGTLYFPFTPTLSATNIASLGVSLPRLTGWGREPGWMAMFCVVTWFYSNQLDRARWLARPLLLVGLLGTTSTAGFGVFVVVAAVEYFLRPRAGRGLLGTYLWATAGLAAVGASIALAVGAPVLGLVAKASVNSTSLDDRSLATKDGFSAIINHPLGGYSQSPLSGINLIATIAPYGLPFFILVAAAICVPRFYIARIDRGFSTARIAPVLLTLLFSQPPSDSTVAFLVVGLTYAVVADERTIVDVSVLRRRTHSRSMPPQPVSRSSVNPASARLR